MVSCLNTPHDDKWLLNLLRRSEQQDWCTKIFCSTCAAAYFRNALKEHLSSDPVQSIISGILSVTNDEASSLDREKTFWALGLIFYEVGLFSPYNKAYANMPDEIATTWAEIFFTRIHPQIKVHNLRKGFL